ncbi:MAG TPA: cupredoxin family copper-binding protein [Terriglobales bacterium]|nr:cupredoxin family copper-binding protein [Terriglobales bacterium]
MNRIARVKWGIATLIAGASLMILGGSASQAQHGSSTGKLMPAAAGTDAAQVSISSYAFNPATLTVKAGTTVTWTNHDDDPHSIDSVDGKFKSKALDTGSKFEYRFSEAGEYPYNCRFHPKMTAKIVVQP